MLETLRVTWQNERLNRNEGERPGGAVSRSESSKKKKFEIRKRQRPPQVEAVCLHFKFISENEN